MRRRLHIRGMHCGSCESVVKKALSGAGYTVHRVDHRTGIAEIECECTGTCSCPDPVEVVSQAGYEVVKVEG